MKYSIALTLAAGSLLLGLLLLPSAPSAADPGKTTYDQYCMTCHGTTGAADGPGAQSLDPKPANFQDPKFWEGKTDDYLKKVIKEGGAAVGKSPMMIAWGAVLSDAQIDQVIAHIKTFKKK